MKDEDLEHTLKTLRWHQASPAFLRRSLDAARAERASRSFAGGLSLHHDASKPGPRSTSLPGALVSFIPKPLRIPLAACWLLALLFRLTTPDPISPAVRGTAAHMPPVSTAEMLAYVEAKDQAIQHALEDLLQASGDTSRRSISHPSNPPLP